MLHPLVHRLVSGVYKVESPIMHSLKVVRHFISPGVNLANWLIDGPITSSSMRRYLPGSPKVVSHLSPNGLHPLPPSGRLYSESHDTRAKLMSPEMEWRGRQGPGHTWAVEVPRFCNQSSPRCSSQLSKDLFDPYFHLLCYHLAVVCHCGKSAPPLPSEEAPTHECKTHGECRPHQPESSSVPAWVTVPLILLSRHACSATPVFPVWR